jgi:hypothetical protein
MVHAVTSEFLVNDVTEFAQHDSAIVPLDGGRFAIGWVNARSIPQPGDDGGIVLPVSDEIRGRMFNSSGSAVAQSATLSGEERSDTYFVALDATELANADVAFGWRTHFTDVYEEQTRTFSNDLTATSEINRPEFGGSQAPRHGLDLAATTGADYLLAFIADDAGRIAAVSGASRTPSDTLIREPHVLSLFGLSGGNAGLVYFGPLVEGSADTLNFQALDSTGTATGLAHLIPYAPGPVDTIDTAQLSNGNVAVVLGFSGGHGATLIIDQEGNVVIPPLAGEDHGGTVSALDGGGFAVAWTETNPMTGDGSGTAIKTQAFSDDGVALGPEILVNTSTLNDQFDPAVTGLTNHTFVVSWTDSSLQGGDASSTSIKARVFTLEGIDRPNGAVESTSANEVFSGDREGTRQDIFFFDTQNEPDFGTDRINKFGLNDLLVTTSPVFDRGNDGIITFGHDKRLDLPDEYDEPAGTLNYGTSGLVEIRGGPHGNLITKLHFDGSVEHDGVDYFVYSRFGSNVSPDDLLFV